MRCAPASEVASGPVTATVACASARRAWGAVTTQVYHPNEFTAELPAAQGPVVTLNYFSIAVSTAFMWWKLPLLTAQLAGAKYRAWEDESAQRTAERRALRRRLDAALEALQLSEREDCQVLSGF